jgi:hypothetical protein
MNSKMTLNETVREALGIALIQVMESKPFSDITIQEIASGSNDVLVKAQDISQNADSGVNSVADLQKRVKQIREQVVSSKETTTSVIANIEKEIESDNFVLKPKAIFNLGRLEESRENYMGAAEYYNDLATNYVNDERAKFAKSRLIYLQEAGLLK